MPNKRSTPWLKKPFKFTPFFTYATGTPPARRRAAAGEGPGKDKKDPDKEPSFTTQAVGEEGGEGAPPPGKGPTTPAIGEEGAGNVPTTTIAKGEEAGK